MKPRARPGHTRGVSLLAPDALCAALYALLYCALFACWPAVPAQDAPAWVYEATLLHRLAQGHATTGCRLVAALPPNAFAQLSLAGLQTWLTPQQAGRLYMAACVLALCAALVYLCRARDPRGRSSAVLSVLPLCAGYPLYHGFLNYCAALPVLCLGIGLLLRDPEARGRRGLALLLLLPMVLYTCHGTALGVWGLILGVQCWVRRSWRLASRAALGFIPVLVLLGLYVQQRGAEGAAVTWSAGSLWATALYRARSPLRFFSVFQGFAPTFDDPLLQALAPLLVVLNVGYAVGLCVVGLAWSVRSCRSPVRTDRFLALSLLALSACFVLLPHDIAKMLNPAERLLLPAAMLGAAGVSRAPLRRRGRAGCMRVARRGLYLLLALQSLYVLVWGSRAASAAADLLRARARYGFGVPVVEAQQLRFAPSVRSFGWVHLLPHHQALAMQGMLEGFRAGWVVAPFDTGLFRCQLGRRDNPTTWELETFRRRERPLVLLGRSRDTLAVAAQLGPGYRRLHVGSGFMVVQRTAAQSDARTHRDGSE